MQAAFRTRRQGGYVTPKPSKRQIPPADFAPCPIQKQPAHRQTALYGSPKNRYIARFRIPYRPTVKRIRHDQTNRYFARRRHRPRNRGTSRARAGQTDCTRPGRGLRIRTAGRRSLRPIRQPLPRIHAKPVPQSRCRAARRSGQPEIRPARPTTASRTRPLGHPQRFEFVCQPSPRRAV